MAVNNKRDFLKLLGALGLGALGGALTSDVVYRLSEHSVKFQGTLPGYSVMVHSGEVLRLSAVSIHRAGHTVLRMLLLVLDIRLQPRRMRARGRLAVPRRPRPPALTAPT